MVYGRTPDTRVASVTQSLTKPTTSLNMNAPFTRVKQSQGNPEMSLKSKDNEPCWTVPEVKALIEGYRLHENKFMSPLHNKKTVWEKISSHLNGMGIMKTGPKCDEKWRNLKKSYDKILQSKKKTGNHRVDWIFFEDFEEIYFHDPRYNPVATASSSGVMKLRYGISKSNSNERNIQHTSTSSSKLENKDEEPSTSTSSLSPGEKKRKKTTPLSEIERNKQKRHEERIALKREIFEWVKENYKKNT